MGGGGHIIIQKKVAETGDLDVVKEHCGNRSKLDAILSKTPGTWTNKEFRFVLRAIAEAYDELT